MNRKLPYDPCQRRYLPVRLRSEILHRQNIHCADCDTHLILGSIVFDHRPALGLRDSHDDANDPDRLAAICQRCHQQKTSQDLKAIARRKRLAFHHQRVQARQRRTVTGQRAPSPFEQGERAMSRSVNCSPPRALEPPLQCLHPIVPVGFKGRERLARTDRHAVMEGLRGVLAAVQRLFVDIAKRNTRATELAVTRALGVEG
jgi:hypothetical protein